MKKLLPKLSIIFFVIAMMLFNGCQNHNYNYANWKEYHFQDFITFRYPNEWKMAFTENNLLYFYIDTDSDNPTIMAFQSRSYPIVELNTEGATESNAYCDSFNSIKTIYNETGPIPYVQYGVDLVNVNGEIRNMKYLDFSSQSLTPEESDDNQLKLFFTEEVSEELFQQLYHSFE